MQSSMTERQVFPGSVFQQVTGTCNNTVMLGIRLGTRDVGPWACRRHLQRRVDQLTPPRLANQVS